MSTEATIRYRRPPGVGFRPLAARATWAADDHFLIQTQTIHMESYRRFSYRDVQAILVRRTSHGQVNTVLLTLALLTTLAIGAAAEALLSLPFWLVVAALAGCVTFNLAAGPTADCRIRTAVSLQQLPGITRLRAAGRFVDAMTPLIMRAQSGGDVDS